MPCAIHKWIRMTVPIKNLLTKTSDRLDFSMGFVNPGIVKEGREG